MFVAMPTAMPRLPLTSRFGKRAGSTVGSRVVAVVGVGEVDGVLVDVAEHLHRDRRELALGVPQRPPAGRSGSGEPKFAVTVDERVAEREVLRHARERVVDRRVAVRVVLAHHVADDARALRVLAVGAQAGVVASRRGSGGAPASARRARRASARDTMTDIA